MCEDFYDTLRVGEYDTICVELTERSETARIRFGIIADRISQQATGNVAIVRGS